MVSAELHRVRVLFADQLNLARGKYVPAHFASGGVVRLCLGAYALTYMKALVEASGAGVKEGFPDIEAVFDTSSLRPGWERNTQIALADIYSHGKASPLCGRGALRRAIDLWHQEGLHPQVGLESEAYIFQRGEDGTWEPYQTPGAFVYGTGPFSDPDSLIDEIWETAHRCGIPVESINAEFDAPQFELTLQHQDALKACDDFFLFRTMAREVLYKRGFLLSFMPKPIPGLSGSGLHINLSFLDRDGFNVFGDRPAANGLSRLMRGCVAGLLEHHEAISALIAPTVNSYQRLQPASLCGYWANWGMDHRGAAVRVSAETGSAGRIEHRVADCAASPYVAVATLLQAAFLGHSNDYALPAAEVGDGLTRVGTQRHVPKCLSSALDALIDDQSLVDAVGEELIANFVAIKRAEIEETCGKTDRELFDYYAPFI